jgi:serine protease
MVVFHLNSTVQIRDLHIAELRNKRFSHKDETILGTFDIGNLIGYSARLSKETLAQELEHPNVRYIEADQEVHALDETLTQRDLPTGLWGLARISSQAKQPVPNNYQYWGSGGDGVVAYVIDTGIQITHTEFAGRASYGANFISGETDPDGNGHGTHVAGTIGGTTYGIAKKVKLVAVKVLSAGGSGSWTGVVSGIDWVTKNHQERGRDARSVANMSLGGGATATVDQAVLNSVAAGVNHVVAAGNSAADACNYSPARASTAITVGSIDNLDARSYFSNIGVCVDVFAPGSNILSAWIGSTNTATNTISGTSMASPHVAGAVAQYLGHDLSIGNPVPPTTTQVEIWVRETATSGIVSDPGTGSPNRSLFSPFSDVE